MGFLPVFRTKGDGRGRGHLRRGNTHIQIAVNEKLWMNAAYGWSMGPKSKTDREGRGVIPDIRVPADEALRTACQHAGKPRHGRGR